MRRPLWECAVTGAIQCELASCEAVQVFARNVWAHYESGANDLGCQPVAAAWIGDVVWVRVSLARVAQFESPQVADRRRACGRRRQNAILPHSLDVRREWRTGEVWR